MKKTILPTTAATRQEGQDPEKMNVPEGVEVQVVKKMSAGDAAKKQGVISYMPESDTEEEAEEEAKEAPKPAENVSSIATKKAKPAE